MTEVLPKLSVASRTVRGLGGAALAVAVVGLLWPLLRTVLATDRGLDLTDEGLYLLASDPPSLAAAWGTPAGWHTAPLFRAVGYEVADFRTLGAVMLVMAAGVLGFLSVVVGQRMRMVEAGRSDRVERAAGALLGGLGGLLYYGGMLRTPSYNWVTVFGATVATVGLLIIVTSRLASDPLEDERDSTFVLAHNQLFLSGVAVAGFGAFFTVPAKPTTSIFFALLAVPLLRLAGDVRFVGKAVVSITGASLAFLVAAVAFGFWPLNFMNAFFSAVSGPSLLPRQSLAGALLTIPTFPLDFLRDQSIATAAVAFVTFVALRRQVARFDTIKPSVLQTRRLGWVALFVLTAFTAAHFFAPTLVAAVHALPPEGWSGFIMGNRATHPVDGYVVIARQFLGILSPIVVGPALGGLLHLVGSRSRYVLLLLTVIALNGLSQHMLTLARGSEVLTQFVWPGLTRGTLLAALGIVVFAFGRLRPASQHPLPLNTYSQIVVPAGALWLIGVSTGFGSGHGLVRQAALAAGILVAGLLVASAALSDVRNRLAAFGLVAAVVLPATLLHVVSNFTAPYRIEPISAQTVKTPVGVDGASLRLDEDLAGLLVGISNAAESAGWEPGTPMLAVASRWSSTLPWHLGARVPDSLMLTIGGYEGASNDRLDFSLEQHVDSRFREAWLLVSKESHARRQESVLWAQRASEAVGRSFPADYVRIFESGDSGNHWVKEYGAVELWRPKDS